MSASIELVTIGGVDDKRLVLDNAQAARVINIGTSWSRVRIGMRLAMSDSGGNVISTPRLYVGMLASPSASLANGPLSVNCSHFVGFISPAATFTRNAGPPVSYSTGNIPTAYAKKVVNTISTVSGTGLTHVFSATANNRTSIFVELTKGAPNFTIGHVCTSSATVPDVASPATIRGAMEVDAIAGCATYMQTAVAGSVYTSGTGALAVDEAANGYLNAVCVAWDRTNPVFKISEVYWAKMA